MTFKEPKKLTLEQIKALEFHPLADLFPLLEGKELDELTQDIDTNGLRETIMLYEGKILDGRNRYNACRKLGLGTDARAEWYPFVWFAKGHGTYAEVTIKEAAITYVISRNIMRRHLTDSQRAAIAAKLYAKMPKQSPGGDRKSFSARSENDPTEVSHAEQVPSAEEQKLRVAATLKVSKTALEVAAAIGKADPAKLDEVAAGKKDLYTASDEVKAAKKHKPVAFDADGINQYVKDKAVLNWLHKMIELYEVPKTKQAGLAALLLGQANQHNDGKLTLPFVKDRNYEAYIPSLVEHGQDVDAPAYAAIEAEAAQKKWQLMTKEFNTALAGWWRIGHEMVGWKEKHPQINFSLDNNLRDSIKLAKTVIDKLAGL
jgi:hypothetical protein